MPNNVFNKHKGAISQIYRAVTILNYSVHSRFQNVVFRLQAPSATHSTFSPHMYPGSYFSQAMQTALPTVATSTSLPGSAHSTAHPGFSEIPMQTPIIPNALGAPSFQLLQPKAKNDRLEVGGSLYQFEFFFLSLYLSLSFSLSLDINNYRFFTT